MCVLILCVLYVFYFMCVRVCVCAPTCLLVCVSVPLRHIIGVEVNPSRYTRAYQHTRVRAWVRDGTRYYNKVSSGKVSSGGCGGCNDAHDCS